MGEEGGTTGKPGEMGSIERRKEEVEEVVVVVVIVVYVVQGPRQCRSQPGGGFSPPVFSVTSLVTSPGL